MAIGRTGLFKFTVLELYKESQIALKASQGQEAKSKTCH